jgi:Tol biopolymer transport system component
LLEEERLSVENFISSNEISFFSYLNNKNKHYSYNLVTGSKQEISTDTNKHPDSILSPDKKKIAYLDRRDGKSNVFIANPSGTNEKKITEVNSAASPIYWSLDDKFIFFVNSKPAESALYIVSADGMGTAKKIVDIVYDYAWY